MNIEQINSVIEKKIMPIPIQDYGINGIQVENECEINKILFGVDYSNELVDFAIEKKANLIIVHHGIFWGKELPITKVHYQRIKKLINNDIGLIAYHLPLDLNQDVGNNITILRKISATNNLKTFYKYKNIEIGYIGELTSPSNIDSILSKLEFGDNNFIYWDFGKKDINRIGVVSGGGARALEEACENGVDLFITGETDHSVYHIAKELKVNLLFGGHYFTETFGIKELMKYISKETSINCEFIDIPTML